MHQFRNDYSEGAAPEVLAALTASNFEQHVGYTEGDSYCKSARTRIRELCQLPDDALVEFCIGGTSANVIGINCLLNDWEGVIATPDAHINVHETGAIQASGKTILPTKDTDGFLTPDAAEQVYVAQTLSGRHMTKPAAIYISNTTELGGVWTKERFDAICAWAKSHDLKIFLDGARLGSALTSKDNDLTLPYIANNVDAFYIGGTKNGLLFGEAFVSTHERVKESFGYVQKQRGGLMAKGRLLGVQFGAMLQESNGQLPYFSYAQNANDQAEKLAEGLIQLGFKPYLAAASNQRFFTVSLDQGKAFGEAVGAELISIDPEHSECVIRFVTSWATTSEDVDELLKFAGTLN